MLTGCLAREIVKTVESGIPQNFARTRRRTRKGAVAAAAEADDENGDELPAAPARNAAEARGGGVSRGAQDARRREALVGKPDGAQRHCLPTPHALL